MVGKTWRAETHKRYRNEANDGRAVNAGSEDAKNYPLENVSHKFEGVVSAFYDFVKGKLRPLGANGSAVYQEREHKSSVL